MAEQIVDAPPLAAEWVPLLGSLATAARNDPRALWSAFSMIMVSEIGDKTFLIAAILAMRNAKTVVFAGAFSALALMSVLSALMGAAFPSLLPKAFTTFCAAALFLVFGVKMLQQARDMTGDEIGEEWHEAEREIEAEQEGADKLELAQMEAGGAVHGQQLDGVEDEEPKKPAHGTSDRIREGARNLCGLCFSATYAQAFVLTFLGEWGDRSQIATIALAAAHSVALVSVGTIVGHAVCTGIAVLCGSWLARRISVKHVTLGGAALFLLFGVLYLLESVAEARDTSFFGASASSAVAAALEAAPPPVVPAVPR